MKNTRRISLDVPIDIQTAIKIAKEYKQKEL
jgi:hypothetical protein